MKILKRIGIAVICIPLVLIFAYIVFEFIGMAVNHYSTHQQTNSLKETILSVAPESGILATYSETGNISGTGNHVDMLSVILLKTDMELSELERSLNEYYPLDDCTLWVEQTGSVKAQYDGFLFIPEEAQNTCMVYLCQSAPFVDNIEGH